MLKNVIISVDAMGGANAPYCVLSALDAFAENHNDVYFLLFGKEELLKKEIAKLKFLKKHCEIVNAQDAVSDNEQPIRALKTGKQSSMFLAIEAVKEGRAQACISGGNTGALMVMSKMTLGTLEGIKRPAIVNVFPSIKKGTVILDLGANADCDPSTLFQFALMGTCFAKIVLEVKAPSIGILNVGTEDYKGREVEKKTYELLKNSSLNFYGNVEGYDLTNGTVDVIVTDGFIGNIAIKVSEGTAKICQDFIKQAFKSSFIAKLAGIITKKHFKKVLEKVDPRNHNGAMFIGLNGVVVKSHGSSDDYGFKRAVDVTYNLVKKDINKQITDLITTMDAKQQQKSIVTKIKEKLGF